MHLIQTLAAGVKGAENGTATIVKRGTSTNATYYTDFDGGDGGTTGSLTLDSNGGAVRYVDELVDVVVKDSSGTTVRSFTEMVGSGNVEVKSQSFTGTHYDTGASAASNGEQSNHAARGARQVARQRGQHCGRHRLEGGRGRHRVHARDRRRRDRRARLQRAGPGVRRNG
jgi:hypothetical protein